MSKQKLAVYEGEALNNKAVLSLVTPTGDRGFILPIVENKDNII